MTSGKGGSKQPVTLYYMSQHFGVCSAADALRGIIIKEKQAWLGWKSLLDQFDINLPDLFGGAKKEGGAQGTVTWLPGTGTQVLPDELAQKLGRANGADCPGYRGISSVFFSGSGGQRGFYWTANNPYLPGVWVTVQRAPKGLTADYRMIPRPGSNEFPYEQPAVSGGSYTMQRAVDQSGSIMIYSSVGSGAPVQWWSLRSMSLIGTSSGGGAFGGSAANVDVATDGTAIWHGVRLAGLGLQSCQFSCPTAGTVTYFDCADAAGPLRVFDHDDGSQQIYTAFASGNGYLDNGLFVHDPDNYAACDFCLKGDDTVWGLFEPTGSSNLIILKDLTGGSGIALTITGIVTRSSPGSPRICHVQPFRQFFVISDGKWYTIDDTTGTIKASGSWSGATNNLPLKNPRQRTFWSDYSEISLEDASTVRTIDPSSWNGDDSAGGVTYDPYNHALWTRPQFAAHLDIRLLDRGDYDANPAHVAYECLTNDDWGMGSPTSLIDVDSFEAAGVTLFDENFGISLIWTRQAAIQDFIQEILDHIQGALFVDPQTGLLTLKLIRGDYDVDTLPTISPSVANLTNFSRKLWGEIVNEITVTWTNPENEQDETVTAHDLASITTQGGIVSDSRNYYGVRNSDLAARLAARDLRSAGAPLAMCDAEVDRSFWSIRPASVLLLDWPEYGLDGVVMRVTSVDYGKPGDPTIKLSLIEDVFGLDAADYVEPPTTSWVDPSAPPSSPDEAEALTLPFFFAANGISSIDGAAYPEVLAGVLAASSNCDTFGYELWDQVTLTDGSLEWQSVATLNIVGHAELAADLPAEASSTGVAFTSLIGTAGPVRTGFAIIGNAGETGNEIALITGASSTFGLSRGVLDTVPHSWSAGTPIWFVTTDTLWEDPTARSSGEVVSYKLRTRTSQGLLPLADASTITATLTDRPWQPSRPADVSIDGVTFNDISTPIDMIGASVVPVEWANRNRLTEDAVVLSWTDGDVTPETGQTTKIIIYATDGTTVIHTHSGLTGTSFNIPSASFGGSHIAIVEVRSERTDDEGTFASLQGHRLFVQVGAATFDETDVTFDSTAFTMDED